MQPVLKCNTLSKAAPLALACALGLATSLAVAGGYQNNSYPDHATVTRIEPIYRTVRISDPHQECWNEQIHHSYRKKHGHSAGSTIVGGIIGGVIGHKIGKSIDGGRGKHGATVLGTLVGAAIGNEHADRHHSHNGRHQSYTTVERRCKTVNEYYTEERLDAYRVTYEYNGQVFHTRMKHRPGDRIRVNVQVTPSYH